MADRPNATALSLVSGETWPVEDPPDHALHSEGERIALEVTRLFHPKGTATLQDARPDRFTRIMHRAEALARSAGLPVLDVLVYFSDRQPLKLEETARLLVDFVRDHPIDDCQTFDPPDGGVIRVARPRAGQAPRWTCNEGGLEPTLTRELLDATIQTKNADLDRYRARYDRVHHEPGTDCRTNLSVRPGQRRWRWRRETASGRFHTNVWIADLAVKRLLELVRADEGSRERRARVLVRRRPVQSQRTRRLKGHCLSQRILRTQ